MEQQSDSKWQTKYRPTTLDEMIGHEQAVTRIQGMINKNNVPTAMMLIGPPSVGKTTLARVLATALNGKPIDYQVRNGTYREINVASEKSIDDMREVVKLSKFKPQGKKNIIVLDESQQLMTNKQALQVIMKPLEDSGNRDTIWILATMDVSKFQSNKIEGKAILDRCSQIVLKEHTQEDMMMQAKRIIKAEKLSYLKSEELLSELVQGCEGMRQVANQLQAISEYYDGLKKKPEKFSTELLAKALSTMESDDDALIAQIVVSVFKGEFKKVQLGILGLQDTFQAVNKILWTASFLLNVAVLEGQKHRKVWWSPLNRTVHAGLKGSSITLGQYAAFNEMAVQLKNESMSFSVDAQGLISARMYRFIKDNPPKK